MKRRACKHFTKAALARGAKVEHREHPEFPKKAARQIARDHLCRDPKAYPPRRRRKSR